MGARRYEGDSLTEQVTAALKELGVIVPSTKKEKKEPPGDDELRDRWIVAHPHTAVGLGKHRRYKDGWWPILHKQEVRREIVRVIERSKAEGTRSGSARLDSVAALADVDIFIPDDQWNTKPNILVMPNGTLNISTRTLREHSPDDYATERLTYCYDPKAKAPSWEYYLGSSLPEVRGFVQEFAGYTLTTETQHEIALWFLGERGTGKSTGIQGFQTMLGPKIGYIGLADIEKSRFALVNLPGKHLCIATEQPALYMQASSILNAIISGEPVTVEKKFEDAYTFIPYTKILWSMNSLPRVADTNDGVFRRVKVIRFPPLAESARDPGLKAAITQEGAGILNWALDGLARLRRRGHFIVPQSVREATEQFQDTNDVPSHFVSDMCALGDYHSQASTLYTAYKQWTVDNGHKAQSATSMAAEWERLGFERYRAAGKTYYRGVKLV